ncbi:HlyD family secretion protein [Stenotrophomonas indicatrix]|uniref:HlyD family secretion protein n=1 Tax=Stenotrophomonas indicatrix TaxID=2045451 RepID=UPI002654545A|nr:HlyD family secretion protein [Stenotrophomonas indicatrix]MDN8645403.1 HlyD family secretion protein [Stenotrophomonas indicatrix]MDN8656705.1 HlyD family secretion protein [Stenotrophomonas indicatrix]
MSTVSLKKILPSLSAWLMPAATILCIGLVLYAWRLPPFANGIETTEDAYVRGQVTVVAPKVDGYVADVLVEDYMRVKSGQPIVRLDDRIFRQRLQQAREALAIQEANLANTVQARRSREAGIGSALAQVATADARIANARAQLSRARADMSRVSLLMEGRYLSRHDFDQTEAGLRQAEAELSQAQASRTQALAGNAVAQEDLRSVMVNRDAVEAQVASARAAVRLAEIDLEHTTIVAPSNGTTGEIGVKVGQYVTPGTQLMAVVPDTIWVIANFKEAQTMRMAPGQTVTFQVDALEKEILKGVVERISPATGSEFSVIKQDNATGNFTKIPQRLSVRISIDQLQGQTERLRPGMSVVVSVDTRTPSGTQ